MREQRVDTGLVLGRLEVELRGLVFLWDGIVDLNSDDAVWLTAARNAEAKRHVVAEVNHREQDCDSHEPAGEDTSHGSGPSLLMSRRRTGGSGRHREPGVVHRDVLLHLVDLDGEAPEWTRDGPAERHLDAARVAIIGVVDLGGIAADRRIDVLHHA